MADYEHSTYGDRIASVYDQFTSTPRNAFTDATVEFLASIAGKRRVLELGIGTAASRCRSWPKAEGFRMTLPRRCREDARKAVATRSRRIR